MPRCRDCCKFNAQEQICIAAESVSPIRACVIAILEKECGKVRGRVLEIGCGGWDFGKRLLDANGCEWYGIDPALVDKKGKPTLATHRGSAISLPFPDSFFDYIIGTQTLEHWSEENISFSKAFREMYRVLKPAGTVSMNVPIHLHGYWIFVRGYLPGIFRLFNPWLWEKVTYDEWRRIYEPLQPYRGWRLCGIPDSSILRGQSESSSWILEIRAIKRGNLRSWQVCFCELLEWPHRLPFIWQMWKAWRENQSLWQLRPYHLIKVVRTLFS